MNDQGISLNQTYQSFEAVSRIVADDVIQFANVHGIEQEAIDNIELCLVELVNNTFEHAYEMLDGKPIYISCSVNDIDGFTFSVSDEGVSMSRSAFEAAVRADFITPDPEKPETWTTSGRGFIIIAELTDSFTYNNDSGRNNYTFAKKINTKTMG